MRKQRGRPAGPSERVGTLPGNIKDEWDDEVPDWLVGDEESNYHTFKIPYGKRYFARKIEKLLFTKDLLLNAEWNKPPDREVNLHRHPAFFGTVDDVIRDCCGYCPLPATKDERAALEEESKIFISGKISFLKDNPGRQEIGSFHPINEGEWAYMAYVGNTGGLRQAIVDGNLARVQEWLGKGVDINRRDHTGRTPLHLATLSSTPAIVQCLVDHGSRITWRLADGRTALHLAAARGSVDMVRILLTKSEHNEEEEARRQGQRAISIDEDVAEESDAEVINNPPASDTDDGISYATGSFVKVKGDGSGSGDENNDDTNRGEPDIYDVNAVAWDSHASPLHLAILQGHVSVVEELVTSFGADVLLPVRLAEKSGDHPAATLTLALALQLPLEQAKVMTSKLLQLGASPAQVDVDHKTPLHYLAARGHHGILDIYLEYDQPAVSRAINHVSVTNGGWGKELYLHSALTVAIAAKAPELAIGLLQAGAHSTISFEDYMKSAERFSWVRTNLTTANRAHFERNFDQPIISAVERDLPSLAIELLAHGADPNTLTPEAYRLLSDTYSRLHHHGHALLDYVRAKLSSLREYRDQTTQSKIPPDQLDSDDDLYLKEFAPGTYHHWRAGAMLAEERARHEFEKLESDLVSRGAKAFEEMYPDIQKPRDKENPTLNTKSPQFKAAVSFQRLDSQGNYLNLFEAAWTGDLEVIKDLTTTVLVEGHSRPPLEIGVIDDKGYSAFSIAVIRGHLDVAEAILAISIAQYKPDEELNTRYHIQQDEFGEDESSPSENDDSGPIRKIRPMDLLNQKCLLSVDDPYDGTTVTVDSLISYAIRKDDAHLLTFLLTLGQQLALIYQDEDDAIYAVDESNLLLAMRLGRLSCVEALVELAGAGLPLDALAAESTVSVDETPKHYRGLTIRGKKRADWATRDETAVRSTDMKPPFLLAAKEGNLEAVRWFISPKSTQVYTEFAAANKRDTRIQRLSFGLLFQHARHAKILIEAGADQNVRDKHGRNLLHLLLDDMHRFERDQECVRNLLELVDPRLLPSMLLERCSLGKGSSSPFALWVARLLSSHLKAFWVQKTYLKILLDFFAPTDHKYLELFDASGNTPVHSTVGLLHSTLSTLLTERPELVYRENTHGFTPLELAEQTWIAVAIAPPTIIRTRLWGFRNFRASVADDPPIRFIDQTSRPSWSTLENKWKAYELCRKHANSIPETRRKLVTLFEVHETAPVSFTNYRASRQLWTSTERDEVSQWLP
ncbi:ankyrin repeat-containing domain protein [Aspergillus spectabilis]